MLAEVTAKAKRQKYSRKNNPAVELMRRVVAAKKKTDLSLNDYYQYNKYEKITLSLNDLKPEQARDGSFQEAPLAGGTGGGQPPDGQDDSSCQCRRDGVAEGLSS